MEKWKKIDFYPNYEVSNSGRIRNKNTNRILTQSISRGYLYVSLWSAGKGKSIAVHRLVALHFVKRKSDLLEVNHIDCNRTNNQASNLEWVTRSQNMKHAYKYGVCNPPMNKKSVIAIIDGLPIAKFSSIKKAAESTGSDPSHITKVCKGILSTTNGYGWRYEKS